MNLSLKHVRPLSPAEQLAYLADRYFYPLILSTHDVHSWVDQDHSTRSDRAKSRQRRAAASHRLFAHPATPELATWLLTYAPPAKIEIGLIQAHEVLAKINAGCFDAEIGAMRLQRLAKRSWNQDRSKSLRFSHLIEESTPPTSSSDDSLAAKAIEVLRSVHLHPSKLAEAHIGVAVDQGVDFLVDEASRLATQGAEVFDVRKPGDIPDVRRASMRVAHGHPAGRALRRLVLGQTGLIHYAIRAEHGFVGHQWEPGCRPELVLMWTRALARVEGVLLVSGPNPRLQGDGTRPTPV